MGGFVNNKLIGISSLDDLNKEFSSHENKKTDSPKSEPILAAEAQIMMDNYIGNALDLTNDKDEPIKGFYFDAKDIKKVVSNLTDANGWVYIALAKKSNQQSIKNDFTLIVTAVTSQGTELKFHHHAEDTPWFEFCKPCPDQCPKW